MREMISHYRILERIGAGGMGEVFKAHDLKLNRTVALKFLSVDFKQDDKRDQLLFDEAQAAASLNHPNIATVYEVERDNGLSFIAMEYVEGASLDSIIKQRTIKLTEAINITIQIAEALRAAHARGLIHCDIKSSNIRVTPEGRVKLLDYGLARLALGGRCSVSPDRQSPAGTLGYMSPEQLRGDLIDQRTDIFSCGVVLYEMVAGRRPFEGESRAALMRSILEDEPPRPGSLREDVPLELESIIRRSLEKSARERYSSAEQLLDDLRRLKHGLENDYRRTEAIADRASSSEIALASDAKSGPAVRLAKKVRALSRRYQKWLLGAGLTFAALALVQLALSSGRPRIMLLALLMLAAVCLISYALIGRRRLEQVEYRAAGAAFRGLVPFQEADRDRFYGRETDTEALVEKVSHEEFRFGVLFGESGCGKTSAIRAGLVPRLWEEGYVPIYCRSYKDPLGVVVEEARRRSQLARREAESPVEYLSRVIDALGGPLVIVLDQFEEFFVNIKSKAERDRFISFVSECCGLRGLRVKFLVSMRSDFLYLISTEFAERVPEPLAIARLYHLTNFDERRAVEVIERSARKANLPFEPGLSLVVARDLAVAEHILPSELQIVGERLQSRRIFTAEDYRRAGGKESLVHSFLEDVVQASGDRETCCLLLRGMISDESTRLTLTFDEIAERTQRGSEKAKQLLALLVSSRLVREIQDDEPWRYELMHEYLIEKINHITGRVMDATQRANRLLRQYSSNYVVDKKTRIPISKLWFIRRYSDIERTERERELFKKSLRWGLVKSSALVLFLIAGAALAAAALSISESWEGVRLKDGHTAAAVQAAFSPDGRLLVSCSEDGKVIVWDFARRQQLASFSNSAGWVHSVAFSPDGKWFAAGNDDHVVIVWDALTLGQTVVLSGHNAKVTGVAFSHDSRMLVSMSPEYDSKYPNGRTIFWEAGRWEKIGELPVGGNSYTITPIISPDGRRLITPGLKVWDISSERLVSESLDIDWGGTSGGLSPDGACIVTVEGEGYVSFVDLAHQKLLARHRAHRFHGRSATFSPDGKLVATVAEDIVLWDAATQTKLIRLNHTAQAWSVAFSPDGKWFVSTHDDGAILIWDLAEREAVANLNEHYGSVRSVAFSPDGKRLASASEDRSIIIWDAQSGRKEAVLVGHTTRVTAVVFSPDGRTLASCDQDAVVKIWDLEQGSVRRSIQTLHLGKYFLSSYCLAFSPDGRFIATTQGVFEADSGKNVFVLMGYVDKGVLRFKGQIYGAAFSADGRWLACSTESGMVLLFDTETWNLIDYVELDAVHLMTIDFSPDSKFIVTGEDEGKVRLWQINPLKEVAVIGEHSARVKCVAFSPDGSEVVSAGDDQMIALWDVERRSLITRIGLHTSPVISVAFSPDGKHLASGEYDKSVRIYARHRSLWGYRLD